MTAVRRFRVPPALVAMGTAVIYGTVNVGVPLALSTLGSKHGWNGARPGLANLLGLPPLMGGLVILVLAAAAHARALARIEWRVMKVDSEHLLTPDYLVTDGLYRLTRNPLYVGDIAMWTGWTLFLGSLPVAFGLAALTIGLQLGVRMESAGWRVSSGTSGAVDRRDPSVHRSAPPALTPRTRPPFLVSRSL